MADWTKEVLKRAIADVRELTGVDLPFEVTAARGEGLSLRLTEAGAQIEVEDLTALHRGLFLLSRAALEGAKTLDISQKRRFRDCGAMLDMSRNGVMTVEAVRRFALMEACLGMNFLMLYTEDTYEVPGWPAMGYLRGRYSQDEMRAMDAAAAEMGVEMIPCVQTLGHLSQLLQWGTVPRDQPDILMIDDEETYRFIEAAVASLRACFRSARIHIGMDEAVGVGLGRYLKEHGFTDHFALLSRHLARVCEICRKYGFEPMMWSDMFFRLGSKTSAYYDLDNHVPDSVIAELPEVRMVYWDYYHTDEAFYERMLDEHARLGRGTVFAGGNWVWSGFLPHIKKTEATMVPGLRACARRQVDMVIATMWGDDGAETDYFLAACMLPLFSESCWQGADCPAEAWHGMAEALTGLPWEVCAAFGAAYPDTGDAYMAKRMVWGDPLLPLNLFRGDDPDALIRRCEEALALLKPYAERPDCAYVSLVLKLTAAKAALLRDLRPRYLAGDRAWLKQARNQLLPRIISLTGALRIAHCEQWEASRRRFGWEVLSLRYGAVLGRLEDVRRQLGRYLDGEIPAIEELEAEPQPLSRWQEYRQLVTASTIG
ncbi:MAG: family 20 glycosylhydrolase [Clostridia bacterium]|nr:family 20 glycosylhydrolase [Clostridia bacterium]